METLISLVTILHVVAGFSALIIFWVPAFTRKGGKNHRRIGRWYVNMMWAVVITAVALSVKNAFSEHVQAAVFLGFLALLTAKPLWLGIAVLDNKRSISSSYRKATLWLNMALVVFGMLLIVYGISLNGQSNGVLMFVFGGLGVSGLIELRPYFVSLFRGRSIEPDQRSQWMKQHISNMGISGIAAHTAFLAFGANRLLPQSYFGEGGLGLFAWLSPTVIGTIAIIWSSRKYQPKSQA